MIALTGATGFLGSHIADTLLAAGHTVRVAIRPTSNQRWLTDKDLNIQITNLACEKDCERLLTGTTGLIHCAGVVSAPDEYTYRRGNVETTRNLASAAMKAWDCQPGAAFLLISSLAAHGPAALHQPAVETDRDAPISAYGRSKKAAEEVLQQAPGEFRRLILRPPSLYGPRDREFLPLLRAAIRGWTLRPGGTLTGLSLVDGRDAARAAVSLLNTPTSVGTYFISDPQIGYDWDQIREALAVAVGRRVRRVDLPFFLLNVATRVARLTRNSSLLLTPDRLRDLAAPGWVCDGSRLATDTGFQARHRADVGFRETLNFYRKHNWL